MCGIAGFVNRRGESADRALLEPMAQAVLHRGPDDCGYYVSGPVGLAHRRLSIIDLACGHQPMSNADGSVWITFNGEIFNYVELREELIRKGRRLATRSDTEVILHLYEEKGEDCVKDFNGQWAFAIWDCRKEKLFVSRDRLGVRPLFYTIADGAFLFASEIKALFAHPRVPREVDLAGLDQIFTYWFTVPPRSFFRGVSELPPGHSLTVQDGTVKLSEYWRINYPAVTAGNGDCRNDGKLADQLRDLLVDATRIRLRADVPVGAYLSGGLDSSVITALIRKYTDTPLKTYSVTFEDPEFDESRYQREVIEFLATDHREVRCTAEDIGRIFPEVIRHTEKPILRTAPAPLFLLARLVRENGYKVVLTGEGSDEMLGGYDIFKEAKIRRFWGAQPNSRIRPLLLKRLYPYLQNLQDQSPAYLKAFFHVKPEDLADSFFSHLPRWELTSKLKLFFSEETRSQVRSAPQYQELRDELPEEFRSWDPFCQAQYLEAKFLLPGYILSSQGDRMAMAHSVEGRFPFLDHRVVEFASALPPTLKMKALDEKYILKRCADGLTPAAVRERTKQPYRAPDAKCFLGPSAREYVDELLAPERIRKDNVFHPGAVQKLLEKARRGEAIGIKDNMAFVGILSTQLAIDQFIHSSPGKV